MTIKQTSAIVHYPNVSYDVSLVGGFSFMRDDYCDLDMSFRVSVDEDIKALVNGGFADLFPGDVIVKCEHCGQWAARKTECKHCGAAVG